MSEPKLLLTWPEYYAKCMKEDSHGISAETREVDEALRRAWDALWCWDDGTPVKGCVYFNYGAAQKVARKYGFMLPEENVRTHERIKAARQADQRAFSHEFSWRAPVPHDTIKETVTKQ